MEEHFVPIVVAVIGSNALFAFITHMIDRKDSKDDKQSEHARKHAEVVERIDGLEKSLTAVKEDASFSRKANHLQLKRDVKAMTGSAVKRGWTTVDERAYILDSVDLLHADGENGEMTACADAIRPLPIKEV